MNSLITKRLISIKSISFSISNPTVFDGVSQSILGRWLIEKDYKKVNRKLDLANEDHCGCCYVEPETKKEEDSKEDYYLPFIL